MGMGLAMSCVVGMATARARRGGERLHGNIKARGDSLRVRVYAGPDPAAGRPVYLRETVCGTDEAARRTAQRTLNRLVAEAEKARRPSSVISLGHVIDEWLRLAEHEDSTPRPTSATSSARSTGSRLNVDREAPRRARGPRWPQPPAARSTTSTPACPSRPAAP